MLHHFEVGKLYHPDRTRWPECSQYNYRGGNHDFVLFWRRPSPTEVETWRKGRIEFALLVDGPVIFLFFKPEGGQWSDAAFTWHLVPAEERQLPPPVESTETRALLQITLVDADTGIIRVLRAATLSPAFTAELHDAIRRQAETPWDPAAYQRALDDAYRRHPHSREMAKAARTRCQVGE